MRAVEKGDLPVLVELLAANPLLLLFSVAALGYLFGRITVAGVSLGVAAVLFVGLAFGALDARLKLPDIVYLLGLAIFVYTIGLSSGPNFFTTLRRKGLRDTALVLLLLTVAALLSFAAMKSAGLHPAMAAGLFTGSLTNTPALAAVIEVLQRAGAAERILALPVVGYSVSYPIGVLGVIVAIAVFRRVFRVDLRAEAEQLKDLLGGGEGLVNRTLRVTNAGLCGLPLSDLMRSRGWDVVFSRRSHDGKVSVASGTTVLNVGDVVNLVGTAEHVAAVITALGEELTAPLELDRETLDFRRMFVSNPAVVGRPLQTLRLPEQYDAIVTRVRRGDVDLLPHGKTVLELGDRVRVVTSRANMARLAELFGDSYRRLSEVDVVSLGLGLALGLLLGMIPLPLPGGGSFTLGYAGGPLLVALLLGALERSGPIIWSLPYSANLTLRQFGLTLFLAGVGTRAGYAFVSTLANGDGLILLAAGALMTMSVSVLALLIGYRLLKIPFSLLIGMLAGLQTQPAVLAFANEQTGNELPNVGYAAVYPIATIAKIVVAQLLINLLSG
jgi:putative transport protein